MAATVRVPTSPSDGYPLLGGSGAMPPIGLGTWLAPPGEVQAAVATAVKLGYRHIDAAAAYGNEAEVGAGLAEGIAAAGIGRGDVFVTTKLWANKCHTDLVAGALDASLAALGLEYVDLYLVHWPFFLKPGTPLPPPAKSDVLPWDPDRFAAVWAELEKAVDAGKVRAIGVSNFSQRKLEAVWERLRIKPAVLQVELHPFLASQPLVDWAHAHGVVVTGFSPLGSPARPARLIAEGDPAPLADDTIKAIAAKHGKSPAQVLVRWGVQRGTAVIPKSTNATRLAENLAVFDFALDAEDVAAIARLNNGRRCVKGTPFLSEGQDDIAVLWDL